MQAARRMYVYLMSGISLGALATGLTMLLAVLLGAVGLGPSGEVIGGGDEPVRQQLTTATALTVVSLPLWLVHWLAAERSVRVDRPGGLLERNAPERGLYFTIALAVLLVVGATAIASTMQSVILRLAGADIGFRDVAGDVARAVVALGFWAYHIIARDRDWQQRALTHQAAFLPRAYRYGAAYVGLFVTVFALTQLLELVGRVLLGTSTPDLGQEGPWWAHPLASGISGAVVGAAVWIGHWVYATRLAADPTPRGESERASRVRLAFYVAVIVTAVAATLGYLGAGVGEAIRLALGISDPRTAPEAIGSVAVPVLNGALFAAAWWLHARWLDAEPIARESPTGAGTVDRLRLYPVALVALAFGAVGTAWLIGLAIDALFGGQAIGGRVGRGSELAQFAPYAALGWALWAWHWTLVTRRAAADPAGEAVSTTRRATLLIALAISVLAGIGALGTILYRLFGSLFGVSLTGDPVTELSLPLGILVVAAALAAGHGLLLRRDGRWRADLDEDEAGMATAMRSVRLRLSGPRDGMDAALASLGSATPSGYALELEPEDATPS